MQAVGASFWMDDLDAIEPLRFRRMPVLAAALCFAAGDVLARRWLATFFLAAAAVALLGLAIISLRKAARVAAIPALGFWVVTGCWCSQMQPPIASQAALTHYADGLSRTVRGRVERVRTLEELPEATSARSQAPEAWRLEPGAWEPDVQPAVESVDLDVQAVENVTPDISTMRSAIGGVRVMVQGEPPPLACGDVLEMPLRLRVPETYRDPGAWSHAAELLTEGIAVQASVKAVRIVHMGHTPSDWRCRTFAAQHWAASRLDAFAGSPANHRLPSALRLTPQDAAVLNAMLFGDRGGLSPSVRADFERTGTFHLFVVSGLHIVLLSGTLFWLLRRLRMPEGAAVFCTIAVAAGYAALTGFGVPVQRALAMTSIYLIARWLARDTGAFNALGVAALAVLALDPRALFEASFQMTFLVILAIAGLAAPLSQRALRPWRSAIRELWNLRLDVTLPPPIAQLRVRLRMFGDLVAALAGSRARDLLVWLLRVAVAAFDIVLIGLVAELCMMLPMAIYFHRATLLALPASFLTMLLVGLVICAAVWMFCLSLLSPRLAMLPAAFVALLLHAVSAVVAHLSHASVADFRVPSPTTAAVVVSCAAVAFCCWALRSRIRVWRLTGIAAIALVPLAVLWPTSPLLHPGVLEVTALDVGQGDSLLVVSPQGRTLLVDAGGPVGQSASTERWDIGEEVVAPYLWTRRIRRLDAVLLTHAHSDHMGGMPAVLRDFRPRELWLSVQPADSPGLVALLAQAEQMGILIRWFHAGDTFAWGGLQADVLAPELGYMNPAEAVNDDSLVMRLSYGKASALLEGDAEAPSEATMLAHGRMSPVTLLKVGHHGSATSTNPAFLAAITPQDAVISVGRHNTFGHPRMEVLGRLQAAHTRTFRTDREGAETFLLSADGRITASNAASN